MALRPPKEDQPEKITLPPPNYKTQKISGLKVVSYDIFWTMFLREVSKQNKCKISGKSLVFLTPFHQDYAYFFNMGKSRKMTKIDREAVKSIQGEQRPFPPPPIPPKKLYPPP